MYPDLSYSEKTTAEAPVLGVALVKTHIQGVIKAVAAEDGGCKCGSNCTCDPCSCK
ncbi:hypothetical protein Fmac_028957 [Flemingia macrophylla]|uniref:Metallothionein-like protein n=1 Tax=Flemingia macrophylla TaxID=520843 RepID=A0ABD1L9A6_9FABA